MKKHIVIDGNAFYEVDEDCLEEKRRQMEQKGERDQIQKTSVPQRHKRRPGA